MKLVSIKLNTNYERKTKTVVDTILVTPSLLETWKSPPLTTFLNTAYNAFGRDPEYYRLWGALNLTLCMWLYRRMVMEPATYNPQRRAVHISRDQFEKCLMSLSADGRYLDWLVGRTMGDRDRSPAYSHIRNIFAKRLQNDLPGKKILLPQPAWVTKQSGRR